MIKRYLTLLDTHPISSRIATSLFLFGLGDAMSQLVEIKYLATNSKGFDILRLLKFSAYGACIGGPLQIFNYNKLVPFLWRTNTTSTVIQKIIYDQTIFTVIGTSCCFYAMSRLNGGSHDDATQKIKS